MRNNRARILLSFVVAYVLLFTGYTPLAKAQGQNKPSNQSFVGGRFVAYNYNYTPVRINAGGGAASSTYSIQLSAATVTLPDGRVIVPFSAGGYNIKGQPGPFPPIPITVGAGTVQETVTPTAVSGCFAGAPQNSCTITAAFTYAHGAGEVVSSGSLGIQEAINDAAYWGGGIVVADASLNQFGSAATITADLAAANVYPSVSIEDTRLGTTRYWNPTPTGAAIAAATGVPVTGQAACDATHQMCSDANVAGSASWSGTVFACVTYVDIMGNESPCSATTSWTSVVSKAIDIASPAAKTGAVGWIPYLSLSGGTYAQAYQIPVTSTVCTLTTLETVIPACAVTNATYGQVGSTFGANALFNGGAQITGYPVNTGMHFPALASVVQTTASYTPVTNSSVSYSYAPSNRVGIPGVSSANVVNYAAGASSTTGIPMAVATWSIPAGYFNYIGAEFRVSGKFVWTDGGASDAMKVLVKWDAAGTNSTTIPTTVCSIANTHTNAAAAQVGEYTCTVKIATVGATGTALVNGSGYFDIATGSAGVLIGGANEISTAASSSINLTVPARIAVYFTDTGATANPGAQGLEATLEVLN